mmetsp:Transcript_51721/g.137164  ORF Transcript_51721/g.137164 Transcript_51721/m.137164 type:complete len:315 (-) Transcript_51721:126-1070(-)
MGRPSAASARICALRARSRALSRSSRPASPQARTAPLHTRVCDRGARRCRLRAASLRAAPPPPRRPRRPLAAPLGVAAHRATGCRRSSSSGGWHPAAPRLRRCGGGCGGVRRSIAPLRRAAPSAGVQRGGQGGRQLARLRVRLLLPCQPRWRPVGFGCARRPAARGCGWLRAVRRCSARRAAARPAARTACCAGGCGCASCCSPAPPVARRRQLRCDARPRFGRAAGGGRATRRTHARRAAASSALARARARRPPAGGWVRARSCARWARWPAGRAGPGAGSKEALRGGGCCRRARQRPIDVAGAPQACTRWPS